MKKPKKGIRKRKKKRKEKKVKIKIKERKKNKRNNEKSEIILTTQPTFPKG